MPLIVHASFTILRHEGVVSSKETFRVQGWLWIAAFSSTYLAFAVAALALAEPSGGAAIVWPASGVAVAGLLLLSPASRLSFLCAIAAASMVANLLFGSSLAMAAGFTLANLVECLVAHRIACSGKGGADAFNDPRWVAIFTLGALVAATVSTAIASLTVGLAHVIPSFAASWGSTVFLGILIATPAVVTLSRAVTGRTLPSVERPSLVRFGVYVAVAGLTVATFGQNHYPLLFLPLAGVLLATYSLGTPGAVAAVLLIAVVGSTATAFGGGPIHFIEGQQERIVFLQFYLAVLLASSLPLSSLLARSRAAAALLRQTNRLLETAERTAHVGHWRHEIGSNEVSWSDEVTRIHGEATGTTVVSPGKAIRAYHPADRPMLRIGLKLLLRTGDPFSFNGRIVQPNETVRHVETYAEVEHDDSGTPVALIGVVADVTARVEATAQLELAKSKAEHEAERTTALSETDELTGIANRRKLMDMLMREVVAADPPHPALAFIMFDVDDFKLVNDRFGHGIGDLVLQRIAEAASVCLRDTDLLGRMGGEEFGVVLPGADRDVASVVAERIRGAIEHCWSGRHGLEEVTASFGVAVLGVGQNDADLLQDADLALYAAKRAGKNRVNVVQTSERLSA